MKTYADELGALESLFSVYKAADWFEREVSLLLEVAFQEGCLIRNHNSLNVSTEFRCEDEHFDYWDVIKLDGTSTTRGVQDDMG